MGTGHRAISRSRASDSADYKPPVAYPRGPRLLFAVLWNRFRGRRSALDLDVDGAVPGEAEAGEVGVRLAALVAAVFVASCATADRPAMHPLAMLITGSEASMVRFEAAARRCGVRTYSIDQSHEARWIGVGRDLAAPAQDPAINCAMQWIVDHPEEGLAFVGNGPRG